MKVKRRLITVGLHMADSRDQDSFLQNVHHRAFNYDVLFHYLKLIFLGETTEVSRVVLWTSFSAKNMKLKIKSRE